MTEQEIKSVWLDKGASWFSYIHCLPLSLIFIDMSYTFKPLSQISCPTNPHWRDDQGLSLRSGGKNLPRLVI